MTAYHTFFVTSLDLHLVELEDFKYGGTNITAFRLVDPGQRGVQASNEDAFLSICDQGKELPEYSCLTFETNNRWRFIYVRCLYRVGHLA